MDPASARFTRERHQALMADGFTVVPDLLTSSERGSVGTHVRALVHRQYDRFRTALEAAGNGEPASIPEWEEPGVVREQLSPEEDDLRPLVTHPLVVDAVEAVLDSCSRVDAGLRAPLPGFGHQGLHPDFEDRTPEQSWRSLSAMWCVSEFTRDNGPLRVVPGSHLPGRAPEFEWYSGGMGPHDDEVKIVAPEGSVVLFNNADLWHSGTFNYSKQPRLAVTVTYLTPRER